MTFQLPELDSFTAPRREWSSYQSAVFDATKETPNNLLINAVAGSGKTTTIIEAMHQASGKCGFFAFNKAIAEDIKSRAGGAHVQTLNALGHSLWRTNERNAKLETRKTMGILEKRMRPADFKEYGWQISRIVSLAKANAFGVGAPPTVDQFVDLIDNYQMDVPAELVEDLAQAAQQALIKGIDDRKEFDFDDQLYMPVLYGWTFPKFDTVFIDEAQDLSPIQHEMMERLAIRGARIIAVGDPHQAIYGFRGALSNSMDALQTVFLMKELPLSISYRCPKAVVAEAQKIVPHIESSPSAPDGEVLYVDSDPVTFDHGWMVVCRNNAPLMGLALRHLRDKRPCQVRTNALDSIEGFIRKFQEADTRKVLPKLEAWRDSEVLKATERRFYGKIAGIEDRYETLKLFCMEFRLVSEMLHAIRAIAASTSGPILSTVHKAKGLESKHVFILRPDLMPSKFANSEEAQRQEQNLKYVAITRAQETLTYGVGGQE